MVHNHVLWTNSHTKWQCLDASEHCANIYGNAKKFPITYANDNSDMTHKAISNLESCLCVGSNVLTKDLDAVVNSKKQYSSFQLDADAEAIQPMGGKSTLDLPPHQHKDIGRSTCRCREKHQRTPVRYIYEMDEPGQESVKQGINAPFLPVLPVSANPHHLSLP